jgi:translation elongation factor EF-1alpha
VGVLVISARKGEFETGFEKGGQTREHALLARTLGVAHLIVVINKMDDPTVNWEQARYEECVSKLKPYLKQVRTGEGYSSGLVALIVALLHMRIHRWATRSRRT